MLLPTVVLRLASRAVFIVTLVWAIAPHGLITTSRGNARLEIAATATKRVLDRLRLDGASAHRRNIKVRVVAVLHGASP